MEEAFWLVLGGFLGLIVLGISATVVLAVAMRPITKASASMEAKLNAQELATRAQFDLDAANDQFYDQDGFEAGQDAPRSLQNGVRSAETSLAYDRVAAITESILPDTGGPGRPFPDPEVGFRVQKGKVRAICKPCELVKSFFSKGRPGG